MNVSSKTINFIWIIIGVVFFIPFLGNVHLFDWDEINFAEIAREMHLSGNYGEPQINFSAFTEKPPLFFWLQAISMKFFGVNEFAARFPNALLGVLVLPLIYTIGKKIQNKQFGVIWALVYFGSVLPHLYFKSGIIDPWFNFFIFLSIYFFIQVTWKKNESQFGINYIIAGGMFLGLAILTKGPVALLIFGLTFLAYWIFKRFKQFISIPQLLLFASTTLFVTGLWFGINYLQHGAAFLKEFTIRQWQLLTTEDAGHGGFLLYHFVVLFFGCFPATVFLLQSLSKKETGKNNFTDYKIWMTILFWVVLILFTIVKTKIVHYSSLSYYPISFLAALSIYNIINKKWLLNNWMKVFLFITAFPFIVAPIAAAWLGKHINMLAPLLKEDAFAVENLQAKVYWSGWEFLPGLLLLLMLILLLIILKKQQLVKAISILFIGTAVYVQITLFFFIKKIEGYSQNANIQFWQSHAKEDCYLTTAYYKSYTQFFYGKILTQSNKNYLDNNWLLHGNIDKLVYISCKADSKIKFEKEITDAIFLYNQNGFYFYKRLPVAK